MAHNECSEIWTFHSQGRSYVQSGGEAASRHHPSTAASPPGHYLVKSRPHCHLGTPRPSTGHSTNGDGIYYIQYWMDGPQMAWNGVPVMHADTQPERRGEPLKHEKE